MYNHQSSEKCCAGTSPADTSPQGWLAQGEQQPQNPGKTCTHHPLLGGLETSVDKKTNLIQSSFFISCTRRQVNLQLYLLEAMLEAMVVLIEMLLCLASMVVNLVIAISIRFISFYGTKPLPTVSTSLHYHINIAWCIFQLIVFSLAKQRHKKCLDLNTKITL